METEIPPAKILRLSTPEHTPFELSYLPEELRIRICSHLNLEQLTKICLVNRSWCRVVSDMHQIWKQKFVEMSGPTVCEHEDWKNECVSYCAFLKSLRQTPPFSYSALSVFPKLMIDDPSRKFLSYYYGKKLLFTASAGTVFVWSLFGQRLLEYFVWSEAVSEMIAVECRMTMIGGLLIIGGVRGTVLTLFLDPSGRLLTADRPTAHKHNACVSGLAASSDLEVQASVGNDGHMCIWCMRSGVIFWNFWISITPVQDMLIQPALKDLYEHALFARGVRGLWSLRWTIYSVTDQPCGDVKSSFIYGMRTAPERYIPGVCVHDNLLYYLAKEYEGTRVFGAGLFKWPNTVDQSVAELPTTLTVTQLLGVGKQFLLVLVHESELDHFMILNRSTMTVVASSFVLGKIYINVNGRRRIVSLENSWMDCIGKREKGQVFLTYVLNNDPTSIHCLRWL